MTARCKPGDLAVIVRDRDNDGANLGVIVEVLRRVSSCFCGRCAPDTVVWECRTTGRLLKGFFLGLPCFARLSDIPDTSLRPIRPQADDAKDLMVEKLGPAPKTLTEVREALS